VNTLFTIQYWISDKKRLLKNHC